MSYQGAYWAASERHASGTESGMTAIVLEGDTFSLEGDTFGVAAHEILP